MESNSQRIIKNTGFLFVRMLLVLVVGLYTSRVVLRTLGFEDFGIYNVVGSVVLMMAFLRNALTNATSRYLTYELGAEQKNGVGTGDGLRHVYAMAIHCHVLLAIVMVAILEAVGVWFINTHLNIAAERMTAANWAYQFSLLTFALSIIQTPFNSNIIAHEKMNFYALLSVVEVLLKLGVAYLIVVGTIDKLVMYSGLLFVVAVVTLVAYIVYCRRVLTDCRYEWYWDKKWIGTFAGYSGWSMLVNATDMTTAQCISIFFNWFLGTIANAALGIMNQVISQMNSLLGTFTQAFNPQIIKSYASGDQTYFMKLLFSASKLSYLLLWTISVPVFCNTDFVLRIWLGDYPPMTAPFIRVALVYYLIDAMQCPLWQAVHATGQIRTHQILMASIKILCIPAMYGVLKAGFDGRYAIAIWSLTNGISAVVRTIYLKRLIGLDVWSYTKDVVGRVLLASAITLPLPLYLSYMLGQTVIGFFVTSLISVLLTTTVSWLLLTEAEKNQMRQMPIINKLVKKNG